MKNNTPSKSPIIIGSTETDFSFTRMAAVTLILLSFMACTLYIMLE